MRMAFSLDPDDAVRLPRSKLLNLSRPRYRALRLVWHDSPGRALRDAGLALEERRGAWLLERLTPGEAAWPPGQPPPAIARGPLLSGLDYPLPTGLEPVAAFDGRLATYDVAAEAGPVTMELLRGSVGSCPMGRLTLEGSDAAVRAVALLLAGKLRLTVPRASLAAEALGLVDKQLPAPRHLGVPTPAGERSVAGAFAHAIGHFTDVLLYYAPLAAEDGPDTEPVHQMRVAVRRARSAIAVFRHGLACPDVMAADRDLKALGAVLGPARDWDVFATETLPRVTAAFPDDARLRRLAKAAQRQRAVCHAALRTYLLAGEFRGVGVALAWLSAADAWHETLGPAESTASALPVAVYAAHVLHRRWKKVTAAGKSIDHLDVTGLHRLRLRAKRARYAMEIFRPAGAAKGAERLIGRLATLQQHLGTLNDGAVAAGLMDALGGARGRHAHAVGLVLGFFAAAAAGERPRILRAWEKFRRSSRFWT